MIANRLEINWICCFAFLQKKLTFFAQLHNPEMHYWDFVSRGPFEELLRIDNVINELKGQYPQITIPDDMKSYKELENLWKKTEKTKIDDEK